MKGLIPHLAPPACPQPRERQRRAFRPTLGGLETRQVLSMASLGPTRVAISAMTDLNSQVVC